MRTLEHARAKGREYRTILGANPAGLRGRIVQHIAEIWGIEAVAISRAQMGGSVGEVNPSSGVLKYDGTLSDADKLDLFAHELGHLVLHKRLTDPNIPRDPVLGSAYTNSGPGAIARYSPRAMEEAQASAFATELICPSAELFADWRAENTATAASLAERFGVPVKVAHAQLAHALHEFALGANDPIAKPQRAITFTPRQLEAARFTGKPALVDAGPGTGKTATLIRRIQFLLEESNARPSEILVLTFSNEAAQELRERVTLAFGADVTEEMTIATFHGFGMTFLHHHGQHVGYDTAFTILDEDTQAELVTSILGRVPCGQILTLRDPQETVDAVVEHINYCKQRLRDCDALQECVSAWTPTPDETDANAASGQFAGLYREYESAKHAAKQIDFADLIMLPLRVLEQQPEIAAAYQSKYPWVLVDEFQDVTRATSRLLRQLCGPTNPPWVVGDARQAIYRFLGAAPENVREFSTDFPGAVVFELKENYRSAAPVVRAANELATLMEDPEHGDGQVYERWRAATDQTPLGDMPIVIAEATSDYAEREGVADQVQAWLETGQVTPSEIAVLARRNIDVRNIILALAARGVRAQASGLLTADGAAGDLAAAVTLADAPVASIPRVAFALGRARFPVGAINAVVHHALATFRKDRGFDIAAPNSGSELASEVEFARACLTRGHFTADGFATLVTFLFDGGCYLRVLLDAADGAERAMALMEIVSALSLAVSYRVTHPATPPALARVGFASHLRARLAETTPLPIVARARPDAVRVMTCHASKGLEFPCVIVAGQTVPKARAKYPWIPPSWRPATDEDVEQGDALLFVGVTRGQRAVVVSFPKQAGEGVRGHAKQVVRLLARWRAAHELEVVSWTASGNPTSEVTVGLIWGGNTPAVLNLSALDTSTCAIQTYLEEFLGVSFPIAARALYPVFFSVTRRVLRQVVTRANETGRLVDEAAVRSMVADAWPEGEFAEHPHIGIYLDATLRMVLDFAKLYRPVGVPITSFDPELTVTTEGEEPAVRLDLIGHFLQADGRIVALSFRPESLGADAKDGVLNWSAKRINSKKRMSFVLLERRTPGILPHFFSGADGEMFSFKWSTRKDSLTNETANVIGKLEALSHGEFATKISAYTCDRCRARVSCPHWVGALG